MKLLVSSNCMVIRRKCLKLGIQRKTKTYFEIHSLGRVKQKAYSLLPFLKNLLIKAKVLLLSILKYEPEVVLFGLTIIFGLIKSTL